MFCVNDIKHFFVIDVPTEKNMIVQLTAESNISGPN